MSPDPRDRSVAGSRLRIRESHLLASEVSASSCSRECRISRCWGMSIACCCENAVCVSWVATATRTGSIQLSWTGPGAVRRRTSAARTGSWSFWRRSSIRRTSNTGTWSAGTTDRSTRSAWTRSGRGSAWRTWCAGGAVHWPATGLDRGDRNVSRGCPERQGDRRGRFRCGSRDFDSVYDGHDGTCRVGLWNQSGDYVITDEA